MSEPLRPTRKKRDAMTVVVLRLRDDDLAVGRVVGRIEVIRPGGGGTDVGAIRQLADVEAILLGGAHTEDRPAK